MSTDTLAPSQEIRGNETLQSLTGFLGQFDTAVTEERVVMGGQVHEFVRLGSEEGQSYARVEWQDTGGQLDPQAEHWQKVKTMPASYLFGGSSNSNYKANLDDLFSHGFAPVANTLGYFHGRYTETPQVQAEIWVIPSPEKVNNALQRTFGRFPNDGYPELATFTREDGTAGTLLTKEFFSMVAVGRLPIADEVDMPRHLHDSLVHMFSYAVLPKELFRLFRQAAQKELVTPGHDWDNLPEDDSARQLMKSFDRFTARLSSFIELYNPDSATNSEKLAGILAPFVRSIADREEVQELTAGFSQQILEDTQAMISQGVPAKALVQ